jgi:hypothetical protein
MPAFRRSLTPLALAVAATAALACSDSSAPDPNPTELTIVRIAPDAPPLAQTQISFWAKSGQSVEEKMWFQDDVGENGEEFLRFKIPSNGLLTYPDGRPFGVDDSVRITIRMIDPALLLFEMSPSGLRFNPDQPAELEIEYAESDDDLNDDGEIDEEDDQLETQLAVWRQATLDADFERLITRLEVDLEEIEADIVGFSRYAIAY